MTKAKISEYSATAGNNTDVNGVNIAEGCPPSSMNNMGREIMAALKRFQVGSDGDGVTVGGNFVVSGSTTIANTATLGNVDINGGTIDSAAIGGSTAAAGSFTTLGASSTATFAAGAVGTPAITTTGDTNTGIFFPAADTIAFAEGGAEAMRVDSSGRLQIAATNSTATNAKLVVGTGNASTDAVTVINTGDANVNALTLSNWDGAATSFGPRIEFDNSGRGAFVVGAADGSANFDICNTWGTPLVRIASSGNVGIGTTSPSGILDVRGSGTAGTNTQLLAWNADSAGFSPSFKLRKGRGSQASPTVVQNGDQIGSVVFTAYDGTGYIDAAYIESRVDGTPGTNDMPGRIAFFTTPDGSASPTERARITSGGDFLVGKTTTGDEVGTRIESNGTVSFRRSGFAPIICDRKTNDGELVQFLQDGAQEGSISVSGNTVSYNAFAGGHWSQLQEGRGYNPEIPRGTVMSTIGEMCLWKSVEWTKTTEHPAIPAVEAKEAMLDEEGNVIEPAIEAVEGKDAWTETFNKRESYLGDLPVGATFEEDGFTKTVVDDGNERLPKVKISDVVGDKAVYGVFQTWDEVQDMLVTSLGAFVVRIAAGVTVEIGDLLESNGDGCAKVQDDDVIRSKTVAKVTSTTPTATYDDGSYTVPAVIYCG